ncbi:helix-turn-helix domain-containing protein [Citricoccus parietis]|uniref:Helix-turn-helix domain-containing protein n=2 Tax=Citricoccus parietis TaxID=592307 RepID=A0ABV5G4X2_9MICC
MATNLKNPQAPNLAIPVAAPSLGMTERQLQDAVARREITYVKVGRFVRFRQSDLDDYIARNTVEAL